MKYWLALILLSCLCTGCCVVELKWNRLRVGVLDTEEIHEYQGEIIRESTVGLELKWAPDVDW